MHSVVRTTALTPLLTTEDIKANLRIDYSDDDALIARLSLAVTDMLDGYTGEAGQALVTQTVEFVADYATRFIEAPVGPIVSVTSAVGLDRDGEVLTGTLPVERSGLNMGHFRVDDFDGELKPEYMKITYVAGPESGQTAPLAIMQAAHLMVGHYYENREDSAAVKVQTIPACARTLIDRHRSYWAA